jgi:hypothetical protein
MEGRMRAFRLLQMVALGFVLWIATPSEVDANDVTVMVGGREIVLVIDPDQCELDRNDPSDQRVYDLVERGLAGQNELLLAAADCEQIPPWRNGQRPTLDDFIQVQVGLGFRNQDLTGREVATARQICGELNKRGDALLSQPMAGARDRFNRLSESVKLNESKFMGVVREDPGACYASLVQRVRTDQGSDKLILSVYAHVVIRGRLLYIYRYTEGESVESMLRLVDLVGESVRAHLEANQ